MSDMTLPYNVLAFIAVAFLSALIVAMIVRLAWRWRILDIPNRRSSHSIPTPRGGGLAIVLLTLAGWWCYAFWGGKVPMTMVNVYTAAAALVALTGWFDDLYSLPNLFRLSVHLAAAILLLLGGGIAWQSLELPFLGELTLGFWGFPLAVLWIVGLTNTYNFMDGIDAIAGIQALIAGFGWYLLGTLSGEPAYAMFGMLIAAGSAGFLWWNRPPARIFMGDVGSAFLGFTFAVLPVIAAQTNNRIAVAGIILVWPFVFDSVFTLLRRLSKGENIFQAHRSHLYQRLVQKGWTHGQVSSLYAVLAGISIAPAAMFVRWPTAGSWFIVVLLPLLAGGLWLLVVYQEKCLS
ncbi:MAG: glycosyltransferase family 4 protein [Thermoguttaceae bacterium]|jgi:UDP-N-acetylmuramyl pentapeptide phosphotransferase/UDP-N-acetylglucosamine-1-phosphate transferase